LANSTGYLRQLCYFNQFFCLLCTQTVCSGVSSPKIWWAKIFYFRRTTLFSL